MRTGDTSDHGNAGPGPAHNHQVGHGGGGYGYGYGDEVGSADSAPHRNFRDYLLILRERVAGADRAHSAALALDEFVQLVDSLGPKKEVRITKSEAAFMKQLVKKNGAP